MAQLHRTSHTKTVLGIIRVERNENDQWQDVIRGKVQVSCVSAWNWAMQEKPKEKKTRIKDSDGDDRCWPGTWQKCFAVKSTVLSTRICKFLTVLRNFTYKEDHRNFPFVKRKWIYVIRTLVTQRSNSSPQSLTFFRVYISQLKTYGFNVFIILLSFVSKSVYFVLYTYVPLVLTFNYFVCDWSIQFVLVTCSHLKNRGPLLK